MVIIHPRSKDSYGQTSVLYSNPSMKVRPHVTASFLLMANILLQGHITLYIPVRQLIFVVSSFGSCEQCFLELNKENAYLLHNERHFYKNFEKCNFCKSNFSVITPMKCATSVHPSSPPGTCECLGRMNQGDSHALNISPQETPLSLRVLRPQHSWAVS